MPTIFVYQNVRQLQRVAQEASKGFNHEIARVSRWGLDGSGLEIGNPDPEDATHFFLPIAFSALSSYDWHHEKQIPQARHEEIFSRMDVAIRRALKLLPHWSFGSTNHIFIQWGDLARDFPSLDGNLVLKVSSHQDGNSIAMPYFIDDLEDMIADGFTPKRINKSAVDLSFQGNTNCIPLRQEIPRVIELARSLGLQCSLRHAVISGNNDNRASYLKSIDDSKFVLCPRGCGLNSARFFETLALGRIPVLISDKTKLPLEHDIGYDRFILRVAEDSICDVGVYLREFARKNDLVECSRLASESYRDFLTYAKFSKFLLRSVGR